MTSVKKWDRTDLDMRRQRQMAKDYQDARMHELHLEEWKDSKAPLAAHRIMLLELIRDSYRFALEHNFRCSKRRQAYLNLRDAVKKALGEGKQDSYTTLLQFVARLGLYNDVENAPTRIFSSLAQQL